MQRLDPPSLRIRPGMDVYGAYQNEYIGTVTRIWEGQPAVSPAAGRNLARETGSSRGDVNQDVRLEHEEGGTVSPTRVIGSRMLGEEMGPFPTIAAGNRGPINQDASHNYATDNAAPGVVLFAVRPGRINLGPLTPPLYVPSAAVRSISMERVVLDVQKRDIPAEWRKEPPVTEAG